MSHLVLVRHGKSEWNKLGLWTGITDIDLAKEGIEESRATAEILREYTFHEAHISTLKRARQTLTEIQNILKLNDLPIKIHTALNERHYGIHTGKNKWQIKEEVGDEIFHSIRRGWDHPIPEGETLKDVYEKVSVYYENHVIQSIKEQKNILIVAHGNSLRALIKHIENIPDNDIANVELQTAEAYCYFLSNNGEYISKEIRSAGCIYPFHKS